VHADLSDFAEKWFADRPPNEPWVRYLRTLRGRGCFVGMLSNMVPCFEPYWRAMVPPDGLFDDLVLSHEVGTRKPERTIFDLAAGRAGVPAGRCVLVDDLEPHCAAARAVGWHAVHFVTADAAAAELDELLETLTPSR
jgi:putative hydrolase of the HAD superfamily